MQGFDVDVAKAIGSALGVETCFATPSWDAITAGNWADKWDVSVGSMTITTARQQILDFSVPYYYTPAVIAVRADSGITDLAGLEGQSLCVGASTTYDQWLNHDMEGLGLPESSRRADDAPPRRSWRLPEVRDVFLFGGIASVGYGVYQIYPPSAYVLVGGIFVALGLLIYIGGSRNEST